MRVAGVLDRPLESPLYAARIRLPQAPSIVVHATIWPGDYVLIGRDLVNRWRLLLDGPAEMLRVDVRP
ncbi:MAG: hypothetical protein HY660_00290 [Armatimonadetes bacterium]|nr:hypothetical protein [Armatimonadota bacterium]